MTKEGWGKKEPEKPKDPWKRRKSEQSHCIGIEYNKAQQHFVPRNISSECGKLSYEDRNIVSS